MPAVVTAGGATVVAAPGVAGTTAFWLAAAPLDAGATGTAARLTLIGSGGAHAAAVDGHAAVFRGLLFDRDDLARRLDGGSPEPRNDAALAIDAYRKWGEDFPAHVNGMFSLALWDSSRCVLLITRDAVGTVPLYYSRTEAEFVASPSFAALLAHPGVSHDVNRFALAEHLCHRWLRREETYFARVFRLPPGHVLCVRNGAAPSIRRYRDRFPSGRRIDWAKEEDLEAFDDLFVQAVRRCLTGPVGINLSGGLDSVAVAAIAVEECRRLGLPTPRAFSLAFPEPMSEEDTQRRVAAELGLPLTLMGLTDATGPRGLLQEALDLSSTRTMPLITLWGPAYRTLALEAREQGCATVLTGNGGDDWLTVTPWVAADLIASGDLPGLYEFWRMWQRSYRFSPLGAAKVLWEYGAAPLIRQTAAQGLERVSPSFVRSHPRRRTDQVMRSYVAPDRAFREELIDRLLDQQVPPDPEGFYARDVRRALTSAVSLNELDELWHRGQQAGVELAHPFWDLDLTELLARTPPRLLYRGGRSKSLVRSTLARRFPTLGFERQRKLGATPYFQQVLTQEGPAAWRSLGGAPTLIALEIIDPRGLDVLMITHLQSRSRLEAFRMWYLLSVESWLQGHVPRPKAESWTVEGGERA